MRKRWWLNVRDINGRVIHEQAFRTRRGAVRHGTEVTTPPLNTFEVLPISEVLHGRAGEGGEGDLMAQAEREHKDLPLHCATCGADWPPEGHRDRHKVCQNCKAGLSCRADTTDTVAPDPPCIGSRHRLAGRI